MNRHEISKIRQSMNLTASELSRSLGYSPGYLGQIERGSHMITKSFVDKIRAFAELHSQKSTNGNATTSDELSQAVASLRAATGLLERIGNRLVAIEEAMRK